MEPNVLLVILDSARARNTSLYNYVNETTPFLSEFGKQATVYTQARSPGAKSLTSHTSIFSGLHVEEHNVTSARHRLAPEQSIFEQLRDDGYATGVFTGNTWLTDVDVGLKDGFETIVGGSNVPFPDAVDPKSFVATEGRGQYLSFLKASLASDVPFQSVANGLSVKLASDYAKYVPVSLSVEASADYYVDAFLDWQREQDGPWAACLNLMDPHIPYEPASAHDHWGKKSARQIQDSIDDLKWDFLANRRPWWQRRALEGLYDGTIHQSDAELKRLVQILKERGEYDNTLIVITSDHGEGFGEVSPVRPGVRVAEHGVAIHDVLLHVPLIAKYPGQTSGEQVDEPATLTRFPHAVAESRNDEWTVGDLFVPDGPVIASAVGLTPSLKDRSREFIDDLEPFTATARAVFEGPDDDGIVTKHITWRELSATVAVRNAQTCYPIPDENSAAVVAETFKSISDASVREDTEGVKALEQATKQRLEDLGYV